MADDRPSVDRYFMEMTHLVKTRGTCPRRQVGALIVKDKHVLTTGYNGAPKGFPHPIDTGCIRDELKIASGTMADVCPCLHAEQNAIIQAANFGVGIAGSTIYCTTQPCTQCSRMIANAGITRVVFHEEYADPLSIGLLTTAGVELWQWDGEQAVPYTKINTWEEAQDKLRAEWSEGKHLPMAGQAREAVAPSAAVTAPAPEAAEPAAAVPEAAKPEAAPTLFAADPAPESELEFGDEVEAAGEAAGIRDLSADPRREELIRKLAEERVKRDLKD